MRLYLTALGLVILQSSFAQRVVDVTESNNTAGANALFVVAGRPFLNEKYVRLVDGSPYFQKDWMKGVLINEKGQEYKDQKIKLNLHSGDVHFLDSKGSELVASNSMKEVVITDAANKTYRFIYSTFLSLKATPPVNAWFQSLASGSASLYKYYEKQFTESTPYASSTVEQRIITKEKYYVLYNDAFVEIKKIKDAPSVLASKKTEMEAFLKDKDDKKASLEERLAALVENYNSLVKAEQK